MVIGNGMELFSVVLNDLVSDSSESTTKQLLKFVKEKQRHRSWPERTILLSWEHSDDGRIHKIYDDSLIRLVRLLFDAKKQLDNDDVTGFVLVTSRAMKKVWERLCYVLFTHVHNWTVIGIDVTDQSVQLPIPNEEDVDLTVRNFLKCVKSSEEVLVLRSKIFPENVFNAGFSTRQGGVSSLGSLASLNMLHSIRKPDPTVVVEENQRRLAQKAGFNVEKLRIARGNHGTKIWIVEKFQNKFDKYDGIVTNSPGVTVAAPGADCCIILLGDSKTGACGALHAGWLGTVKEAVRCLLRTMIEEYGTNPGDVLAAIGPSIDANCFSLPVQDAKAMTTLDASLTWPHKSVSGLCHLDLVKANALMLELDGVPKANIDVQMAKCTACYDNLFFSFRRDGIPFGNQLGFITCVKSIHCNNEINQTD